MALQDILTKILDQAQDEIKQIESTVQEKKKELQKQSEIQEKQNLRDFEVKTKNALDAVEKKTLSMARRECSKMRLEMKHEIISALLQKFVEKLETADEKTYGAILEKLFQNIKGTSGKILAPAQRIEITTKKAPQGFHVVAHKNIGGGFIAELGDIKIDNTFQTLVFQEFAENLTLFLAEELKLVD